MHLEGKQKLQLFLQVTAHSSFVAEVQKRTGSPANAHIHRFTPQEMVSFNSSHKINRLSFGEDFPGVVQPLDGTEQIVPHGN